VRAPVTQPSPIRITLVVSTLTAGGAERVMSIMANYWAAHGRGVTLITVGSETTDFYALHPRVRRVALGLVTVSSRRRVALRRRPWLALRNNLRWIRRLRQEIRTFRPDVVISFIHRMNMLTLLAVLGLKVPVIVSERSDVRKHRIGPFWSAVRRLLYPKARAVVVQSDAMRRWAETVVRKDKVYVIPNPVTLPAGSGGTVSPSGFKVVAIGRLGYEKGFDLLLRAFEKCVAEHPDWSLVILGEGPERGRLTELATRLDIEDRVRMPGLVREPAAVLRDASMFVLSSRYEGFPNALLEAMACGVPAVSFDCPSGPIEIVRDGVDGVLVPPEDVDALSAAMKRLMSDESERRRLALRAPEVLQRFGAEKVMEAWEAVIQRVAR
jgi:glycosyltransferase involved in cell wall biosynthesis